jgi:DNA-binding transcriptional MerR regulator
MNKGIGAATLGATLLTGMMFQTRTGTAPDANQHKRSNAAPAAVFTTGEGPWLASCSYWSAAQRVDAPKQRNPSPPDVTIAQTNGVKLQIKPPDDKAKCGSEAWSIPTYADHPTEISAIIATVPDPIHSHLALDFDRSIDAILLAAADNHYLSSDYWLPWRSQISNSSTGESTSSATKPTEEDNARERQPGLIILRYAPDASAWEARDKNEFEWTNYRRVIYLFLVAETPALGVNGSQLENAFHYEKILKDTYHARLSIRSWLPTHPDSTRLEPTVAAEKGKAQARGRRNRADRPQSGATEQQHQAAGTQPQPTQRNDVADAAKIQKQDATAQKQVAEKDEKRPTPTCAQRDPTKDFLSVIGPSYSGSASSLHAGIEAALPGLSESCVSITGATGTAVAVHELDPKDENIYRSFGENTTFEQIRFLQSLAATGYDLSRIAVLSEAGTVFGANSGEQRKADQVRLPAEPKCTATVPGCYRRDSDEPLSRMGTILNLRFPRELSLLRNAEANQSSKSNTGTLPTPYLDLSLKDYAADDTVQRFSTNQSPLSIEAQLIAIAGQLQRARSQFILISASNVLDDIFLAQFLHRACPDARLVILSGGDLLFERDGENAPYIGSISISPYLLSSLDFGERVQWLHADYQAEEIYNAASFTLRDANSSEPPVLAGYRRYPASGASSEGQQIPLWAAVIGADGYYPLAVLNWCSSDLKGILPDISLSPHKPPALEQCKEANVQLPKGGPPDPKSAWNSVPESINQNSGIAPALLWGIVASFICLACVGHCIFLAVANLWSPFTRDLAIDSNDLPYRRAVYLNIGTTVLAAAAFVTAYPLIRVGHYFHITVPSWIFVTAMLLTALCACICTCWKTWRYFYHSKCRIYAFFNSVSVLALVGMVVLWIEVCGSDNLGGYHSYAGLYFSYRCLRPLSGVSPLPPILLLLVAWYLWAIYQTARLRFSQIHRPRIVRLTASPGPYAPEINAYPLYIPDDALEKCEKSTDNCLYANITCLLISREIIWRFVSKYTSDPRERLRKLASPIQKCIDPVLGLIYFVLFCVCVFTIHIHSLDRFLFSPFFFSSGPTPYELLIKALFFPVIMVALSGWFRVIFIWGAINRGLLEPLERMPIRFAFTRYKGGSWMSMLRQKGLHIRWRDMGRSTESIRQIVHHPELQTKTELHQKLLAQYKVINLRIHELVKSISASGSPSAISSTPPAEGTMATTGVEGQPVRPVTEAKTVSAENALPAATKSLEAALTRAAATEKPCPSESLWDLPEQHADLCSIFHIEEGYAEFCTLLVDGLLADYWDQRIGFVEDISLPDEDSQNIPKKATTSEPTLIQLAEELIVVRYVALIRAVLINIRYQMLLVTTIFVLALIAWNSYPFQPHAFIDWCFTLLLATLSLGFIWVFAQMHRSAILSRITNTTANELGVDFYLRIISFGAVPILTWLAYQFPDIGGSLYKIIQPGLQVVK